MAEIGGLIVSSGVARTDFLKVLTFSGLVGLVFVTSIYSPYLGVCAVILLMLGLVFGMNLRWALLGFIFLLPFDPQIEYAPGFYLYFDLLFFLPALVYSWRVLFGESRIHWASLALVPYLLFAILTSFWRAENLYWFSAYSARLLIAVLFMALIAVMGQAKTITLALGATLIPQVLYAMYQFLAGEVGPLYSFLYPHYEGQWIDRAYGFFFQPNNFGSHCATVSVMLLALGLRSKAGRLNILCYALAAIGFLGVACSGSRGALLGALVGLIVLLIYSSASLGSKVALTTALALVVLATQFVSYAPFARLQTLDADMSPIEGRTTMYLAAGLLFVQHPLIGVGLTNYQELMSSVVVWEYGAGNAAHNTYLQILSEDGVIGFLLFFGPVFYFFYRNLKIAKKSTTALLISGGLTVFFVHGLFDFQFSTAPQSLLLFAVLFGLASRCVIAHETLQNAQRIELAQSGNDANGQNRSQKRQE